MYRMLVSLSLLFFTQAPSGPTDYLMGKPDSPVKIELFSDFQCPACRTFYLETVTKLLSDYSAGNKVSFIFHDFPLQQHPVARTAARYAIAARAVGHDQWLKTIEYLYECQAEWSYDGKIEAVLARVLSDRDMEMLRKAVGNPAIEKEIEKSVALGGSRSVDQTPTFFVTLGGKEQKVAGGLAYPALKSFIDPYLK